MYTIIFEADTRAGRFFDLALIAIIIASLVVVVLDSMAGFHARYAAQMMALEWCFTLLFTAEYVSRLLCVRRPIRYARSGYGVIDLLAVLPTTRTCHECLSEGHSPSARFCRDCGTALPPWRNDSVGS